MSGFANTIIGGLSKLVRPAIQSPDFVTTVSGWSINKDGTAEFNDLTARGNITSDELIIPSGAGPGTARLVIDSNGVTFLNAANQIVLQMGTANGYLGSTFTYHDTTVAHPGEFSVAAGSVGMTPGVSGDGTLWKFAGALTGLFQGLFNPDRFKFGDNGPQGGVYYEEWQVNDPAAGVLNNTPTTLIAFTLLTGYTDYPTAMAAGVFTAPETGPYDITFFNAYTAWVAGSRTIASVTDGTHIIGDDDKSTSSPIGPATVRITKNLTAGDTLTFTVEQVTGATQHIASGAYLSIGRRLA